MIAGWYGIVSRITKVNGTTPGPMEGVTYDVVGAGEVVSTKLTAATPVRKWPAATRVVAASVDDPCIVRVRPGLPPLLILWTEWPETEVCT